MDFNNITSLEVTPDFNIGELVYNNRIFKDLTQDELAQISNLEQPQISRIEQNKNVKLSTVHRVLQALDLNLVADGAPFFYQQDDKFMLGSLIAFKRKSNHMTQQALASKTSLKQPQIVQIEKNNDITIVTLRKILKELDIKLRIVPIDKQQSNVG